MNTHTSCHIIGVLDNGTEGLTPQATSLISEADLVIGAGRTLALFNSILPDHCEQFDLGGHLSALPEQISNALNENKRTVVLASGDPLCHGIAKYLIGKLGNERCTVIPNVSTLQLAFARLGLHWQNAHICSIHGKDTGDWSDQSDAQHGLYPLLQACHQHELIAVFTSPENSPARIARMLMTGNLADDFTLSVAEKLLTDDEHVHKQLSIHDAAQMTFNEPNLVILQRTTALPSAPLFGLADNRYLQRKPEKGLITKREVRAVSLARLQLHRESIVWDIGAGSGSVGLEAATLCDRGFVYAIEKNEADVANAQQNRLRMGLHNYRITHGKAPEHLDQWPDPDAVFIGGSGGELGALIELALTRLNAEGWLVMNFVTLENLNTASTALSRLEQEQGIAWDVTQLQASRSRPILNMHRMQAENPVWIVCAQKAS